MMNKKALFITAAATALFAAPIAQAQEEYLCDGKTYDQLLNAQMVNGQLMGTKYDGCRNFKAVSRDSYYLAGGAPTASADSNMSGNNDVTVFDESSANGQTHWWAFIPKGVATAQIKNAILFVPGANVDSSGYSPLAINLTTQLTKYNATPTMVIITRYPAFQYGTDKPCNVLTNDIETSTVTHAHTVYSNGNNQHGIQIDNWVVGGHSEGGEGMSEYLRKLEVENSLTAKGIKGAFWLASYPSNVAQNIPDDFCSLGIAGGGDLGLNQQTWIDKKTNGDFPEKTIYYDFQNGFWNGIHSYLGSYCPLTPGPAPQDPVLSGELQYYEVSPDPSVHPLQIDRYHQDQIIFGTGNVGNMGVVGLFALEALNGQKNAQGVPLCQIPLN